MTFVGLKISKPNIDVQTAENKDLVLNSDLACLKVVTSGKYDFTLANGANSTYTINHSLGVIPLFIIVYICTSSGTYKMASPIYIPNYWSDYLHCTYEFTDTDLYVSIDNATGAEVSSHFYYFVCYA